MAVLGRKRLLLKCVLTILYSLQQQLVDAGDQKAKTRPNVIIFVVDDMGWANIGFHNPGPHIQTPNFDTEAHNGTILMRHYTYCWCAPTRSALMTGRLPYHVLERPATVLTNSSDPLPGAALYVDRRFTMLPAKLAQAGYSTHHVGKWHLGVLKTWMHPVQRGFNTSIAYMGGAEDHYTQKEGAEYGCVDTGPCIDLWENNAPAYGRNGVYGDQMYSAEVQRLIAEHEESKPLFMYVAAQVMHAPMQVPELYSKKFPAPTYTQEYAIEQGMGNFADEMFGNMTAALKKKGIWDNTLIIMLSDNGGPSGVDSNHANNWPLRGGKTNFFEGGIRVPAFVGGGYLPDSMRGKKLDGYISVADWYATLLPLAGADASDDEVGIPGVDGLDMWPYLTGHKKESPRTEILVGTAPVVADMSNAFSGALISGRHKIVLGTPSYGFWTGPIYPNASTNPPQIDHNVSCRTGCLFDIISDPGEHHDLAESMPETLHKLIARWRELNATRWHPDWIWPDAKKCDAYRLAHKGFCGPYQDDEDEVESLVV